MLKEKNTTKYPNWPQILDHPYKILIIDGLCSTRLNKLVNLMHHQPGISKIYLYTKDPYEVKHELQIN